MIDEEPDDVPPVPESRMALRIASQLALVGALGGGIEGISVAWRSRLWLTGLERIELTAGAVVADTFVAFVAGLVGGLVAWRGRAWHPLWRRYQRGFGVGWALLAAFYVLPMVAEMQRRGDYKNVLGTSAMLASITFFGFAIAGFGYRRELIGLTPRIGFRVPAGVLALLLVGLSGVVEQQQRAPAVPAPPHATNVILITVDTLRRDALGLYGSPNLTPRLDQLGREGGVFDGAITPLPETAPSHSAMLTGHHPQETRVVQNGRRLLTGQRTVGEQLQDTGWRTGAFVSSFALDSSVGLDQGFEVYDDDFAPAFRGVGEFRTGWLGLRLILRFGDPADWPALLERRGDATVSRALAWAATIPKDEPIFLWVHLFDPHSPYDAHGPLGAAVDHRAILAQEPGYPYDDVTVTALRRQYGEEVEYTDKQVGALLDGLRSLGRMDESAVLVAGDHGESLGEHDIYFNHHGLYEEVVQVPLILWASAPTWEPGTRNADLLTVMDVANTLLEAAGVPKLADTRSRALQDRLAGAQQPGTPYFLLGRTDSSWLYGLRSPAGLKYIQSDSGTEELYSLGADPKERNNVAGAQPEALEVARRNVAVLRAEVDHAPTGDATSADMLEALGYSDPPPTPDPTVPAPTTPAGGPPPP